MNTPTTEVRGPMTGGREPKPLPFDPAKLDGLSEKLLRSHWENNYIGSVRALNMISERLAAAMKDADLPPLVYGGLKREELHRVGSVILHEQYFGNLGGDGKPAGDVLRAIKQAYGSLRSVGGRVPPHGDVARRRIGLVRTDVQRLDERAAQPVGVGSHARRHCRAAAARARHVRALLSHGLRDGGREIRRRLHAQRELGGSGSPILGGPSAAGPRVLRRRTDHPCKPGGEMRRAGYSWTATWNCSSLPSGIS